MEIINITYPELQSGEKKSGTTATINILPISNTVSILLSIGNRIRAYLLYFSLFYLLIYGQWGSIRKEMEIYIFQFRRYMLREKYEILLVFST